MGMDLSLSLSRGSGSGGLQLFADSVGGSDSNDGLSAAAPKQTIAALSSLVVAGARVNLAKGSTWKERLVITVNGVSVSAYGSGAAPMFDCSDVVAAGSWTKTAGRTNIYQATLTVQTDAAAAEWPGLWIDGARVTTVAASLAALDSTAGAIYYSGVTDQTSITLYVHSTGSTDPRSDGKVYEAAIRSSGIDTYAATGCAINGVSAQRPYTSYGGIVLGRNCSASDCTVTDGNSHNFFGRAFSIFTDCTATDGFADGTTQWVPFIFYEASAPAGATGRMFGCAALATTYNATHVGVLTHTSAGDDWTSIEVTDFTTDNIGTCYQCEDSAALVVNGGEHTNFVNGFKSGVDTTATGTSFSSAKTGARLSIHNGNGLTHVYDAITATFNTTGAIRPGSNSSTTLRNSTITGANLIFDGTSYTGINFTAENNNYVPAGRLYIGYYIPDYSAIVSDNNDWNGMTGTFTIGATTYPDFAAYVAGTGLDANSVNT